MQLAPLHDGACSQQTEFPGFGRFGCTADCGAYTYLTTVGLYRSDSVDSTIA
jgi:hypothetical protein